MRLQRLRTLTQTGGWRKGFERHAALKHEPGVPLSPGGPGAAAPRRWPRWRRVGP